MPFGKEASSEVTALLLVFLLAVTALPPRVPASPLTLMLSWRHCLRLAASTTAPSRRWAPSRGSPGARVAAEAGRTSVDKCGKTKITQSMSQAITSVQAQSCLTHCIPMDCSPPGSSVRGVFQARMLERVAISSSRGFFQPRDQTRVSCDSCIDRQILYHVARS